MAKYNWYEEHRLVWSVEVLEEYDSDFTKEREVWKEFDKAFEGQGHIKTMVFISGPSTRKSIYPSHLTFYLLCKTATEVADVALGAEALDFLDALFEKHIPFLKGKWRHEYIGLRELKEDPTDYVTVKLPIDIAWEYSRCGEGLLRTAWCQLFDFQRAFPRIRQDKEGRWIANNSKKELKKELKEIIELTAFAYYKDDFGLHFEKRFWHRLFRGPFSEHCNGPKWWQRLMSRLKYSVREKCVFGPNPKRPWSEQTEKPRVGDIMNLSNFRY